MQQKELQAIATLRLIPQDERTLFQSQRRSLVPLGPPLPVIHQVLMQR